MPQTQDKNPQSKLIKGRTIVSGQGAAIEVTELHLTQQATAKLVAPRNAFSRFSTKATASGQVQHKSQ